MQLKLKDTEKIANKRARRVDNPPHASRGSDFMAIRAVSTSSAVHPQEVTTPPSPRRGARRDTRSLVGAIRAQGSVAEQQLEHPHPAVLAAIAKKLCTLA